MDAIDFGVCRLAVVPVRRTPADLAEQITQLLFGDYYEVQSSAADGQWLHIHILNDHSIGWIHVTQHHAISADYLEQIRHADFKISLDIVTAILYKKSPLHIVIGSIVPISSTELFKMEEQLAFNGESKSLSQRRDYEFLKSIAMRYVNAPFQHGGKSPFGIDAPALIQMVFRIAGFSLGRTISLQQTQGKKVGVFSEAHPGDIAFFETPEGNVSHVGILLEDNRLIHALGRVRVDQLTDDGILSIESKTITHRLHALRRILPES